MAYTTLELEAYLDEELSPALMAQVEQSLRDNPKFVEELAAINTRREAGVHSIGGVWRRSRISCPSREQLGSYLLGATSKEQHAYLEFHTEVVGCRYCLASLDDLRAQQDEAVEEATTRRERYFQTSAGYLKKEA